jgi:F-type H+-transporting ATPase subunit delta
MGSATREALASTVATLATVVGTDDLRTGEQLLDACRIIGSSPQLRAALANHSAQASDKRGILTALFSSFTPGARKILDAVVDGRWSTENDLLAGIEELGIRSIASSAPKSLSIEGELFTFARAVGSDSELELAVGSKLGAAEGKLLLVDELLDGKASEQTISIVRHLVQQPRGRRVGELMRFGMSIVADQAGRAVATVTSATPLAAAQIERLARSLTTQYGRGLRINQVIDPTIIGGVRIQIGDDVIDGSVATKINDLRYQLAR